MVPQSSQELTTPDLSLGNPRGLLSKLSISAWGVNKFSISRLNQTPVLTCSPICKIEILRVASLIFHPFLWMEKTLAYFKSLLFSEWMWDHDETMVVDWRDWRDFGEGPIVALHLEM